MPVAPAGARRGRTQPTAPGAAADAPGRRAWIAAAALGLTLPILVVWSVRFPPQFDAPNHLARHFLESLRLRGEPLPQGYEVAYGILPNLGGDLVVPLLLCVFDPFTAWKILDSLALLLFWLGPALFLLQQAPRRTSARASCLLLLPLVLNSPFFWGFLNYYSGVGLAFLVLVHLGRLSRKASPPVSGLLVHAVLVTSLFFWHLAAVVLYGAVAGCLVLARVRARLREGERAPAALRFALRLWSPMLPAFALFLVYSAASGGVPAHPDHWEGPVRKVLGTATLFSGYHLGADLALIGLWAGAVWAFFGRSLLAPGRSWLLFAAVALFALYLLLPRRWHSADAVDIRVLPAALVCLVGGLASLPLRRPRLGMLLLVAAMLVRSGSVAHAWQGTDGRLEATARSFECLPPGCRLLPAPLVEGPTKELPEWHLACHAVITKRAFVPTMFAHRNQQPLRLTMGGPLPWSVDGGVFRVQEEAAREAYDFLWICNPEGIEKRLPPAWTRIYSEAGVEVWRIAAPGPGK